VELLVEMESVMVMAMAMVLELELELELELVRHILQSLARVLSHSLRPVPLFF